MVVRLNDSTLYNMCSLHRGILCVHRGGEGSVHRRDILSTSGDVQYTVVFNTNERLLSISSHMNHDIRRCTHGIPPMY